MDSVILEKDNSCGSPSLGCLEETTQDLRTKYEKTDNVINVLFKQHQILLIHEGFYFFILDVIKNEYVDSVNWSLKIQFPTLS